LFILLNNVIEKRTLRARDTQEGKRLNKEQTKNAISPGAGRIKSFNKSSSSSRVEQDLLNVRQAMLIRISWK